MLLPNLQELKPYALGAQRLPPNKASEYILAQHSRSELWAVYGKAEPTQPNKEEQIDRLLAELEALDAEVGSDDETFDFDEDSDESDGDSSDGSDDTNNHNDAADIGEVRTDLHEHGLTKPEPIGLGLSLEQHSHVVEGMNFTAKEEYFDNNRPHVGTRFNLSIHPKGSLPSF